MSYLVTVSTTLNQEILRDYKSTISMCEKVIQDFSDSLDFLNIIQIDRRNINNQIKRIGSIIEYSSKHTVYSFIISRD